VVAHATVADEIESIRSALVDIEGTISNYPQDSRTSANHAAFWAGHCPTLPLPACIASCRGPPVARKVLDSSLGPREARTAWVRASFCRLVVVGYFVVAVGFIILLFVAIRNV